MLALHCYFSSNLRLAEVRAGLVAQERTGRISRCSLTAGPIFDAAVWLNRYSR